jgi:hypothetical protein
MPRFDGTGPNGMGPMTGGARGPCNPYSREYGGYDPYRAPYPPAVRPRYGGYPAAYGFGRPRWRIGRGFWGQGRGVRGRGWGRGRGRGWW